MKKLFLLFCVLLMIFGLCACGAEGIFCNHEYTEEVKPSTCLEQGEKTKTCALCGKIKVTKIAKKSHEFSAWTETVAPSCTADGEKSRVCSLCDTVETMTLASLGHSFGSFKTVVESSSVQNGLEKRTCEGCGLTEEKVIQSINYVDTSVFLVDFDESTTYAVADEKELSKIFEAAVFNRAGAVKFTLDFECDDLNALIDRIVDNTGVPFPFGVSARLVGKELTLTLTHPAEPEEMTESSSPYVQLASANYAPITQKRTEQYDSFKINDSVISYKVSTSEQLYYALERRVRPLPTEGSTAERIYEKIKTVLRRIIDDDMTDFEKARAIYDWLIMNVTYDGELYSMLTSAGGLENSNAYKSFYLEGVFDEGVAVCDGISKAFSAMASIEGIPCVQVSGKQAGNPSGVGHAWNKVYLDGSWYIVDATSGGVIVNGTYEVYSLHYFLMTDSEMAKRYTAIDHTDLICDTEYNPYTDTKIDYLGGEYDFYVESQIELNAVMKYLSEFDETEITVQFKIADSFDVGTDPSDEIATACALSGVSISRSITDGENGETVTVW